VELSLRVRDEGLTLRVEEAFASLRNSIRERAPSSEIRAELRLMRRLQCLVASLLAGACDSRPSPVPGALTGPSPVVTACARTPTPTNPGVPLSLIPCGVHELSGVVRVAGVPAAGATVALLADRQIIMSVVTDRNGAYRFPEVSNFSFSGALVGASMRGYFTDTKYILMTGPSQLDFDVIEASQIPFGQTVESPVGDARCASLGYGGMGGALCRQRARKRSRDRQL